MFSTIRSRLLPVAALLALFAMMAVAPSGALAQEGQPIDLPCVTGVTALPVGQAMPDDLDGRALVLLRLAIAPGGGFTAHTHPGTLIVTIESGTLDLTQLDDSQMDVMRAGSDGTPGTTEPMMKGMPMTLNAGDWFVEPEGMVHTAFNNGDEQTIVLLTGAVDPNQPLVQCVEGTPTA